jgi:hypothetical protein
MTFPQTCFRLSYTVANMCLLPACLTTVLEILNGTFSANVNSMFGWLHRVKVDNFDRISEVRAASVFMTDMCNVRVFLYISLCFEKKTTGDGGPSRPIRAETHLR